MVVLIPKVHHIVYLSTTAPAFHKMLTHNVHTWLTSLITYLANARPI